MKQISLFFIAIFFISQSFAQVTNTVTFVADLTDLLDQGFDPTSDTLEIRGLDWDDGDDVTVTGDRFLVQDETDTHLFKTTLTIATSATYAGPDSLRWKFHGYPENRFDPAWEPGRDGYDGRAYHLQADGSEVEEGPLTPMMAMFVSGITNTVTFKADLTEVFGEGVGFFDPNVDAIEIRGFWSDEGEGWVEASVEEAGPWTMTRNLDPGVVYETTLTLTLPAGLEVGTQTSFKFKTSPDERWADGGWEIGSNNPLTFQEDGAEWTFSKVPNVFPKGEALGQEVKALFQCYLPENALNRYDSSVIPRDEVEFVILKGDNPAIGLWGGDWVADDTLTAGAIALYDGGTHGDLVAGDYIFSREVTFSDTILSGGVIYKFGAQYPDAGVISQSSPLDNSRGVGQNFSFFLKAVDSTVVLSDTWPTTGDPVTSVETISSEIPAEYSLEQNYPNPFNPSTTIRYNIPEASLVTLKVYNMLGQEIVELVNQEQAPGKYEANFDATELSSGIYFYTLSSKGVSISKKMMLIK